MADKNYVLGMDIGGTNVRLGLIDPSYAICQFTRISTKNIFNDGHPVKNLFSIIHQYLQENKVILDIACLSIGFPSTIDKQCKTILSTPNIAVLQNVPVVSLLSAEIDLPVYINRDVNFLMLYDIYIHQLPLAGTIIGCYFGTGLGNAILINGTILSGRNGVAGELGHIPVFNDSALCACGNTGCLETHSSGKYLAQLAKKEFPDTPVSRIFTDHGSHPKILQFIDYLAAAVAVEATIFDPEYIILGGGVIQMPDFPKQLLEKRIKDRTRKPLPSDNLRFIYSHESQANGVIGAGIYAYQLMKGQNRNDSSSKRPCGN